MDIKIYTNKSKTLIKIFINNINNINKNLNIYICIIYVNSKTYFFKRSRIWVSETVGNIALILATCNSESEFCVKHVSIFFTGVADPNVISPSLFVIALTDFNDNGVFRSYMNYFF